MQTVYEPVFYGKDGRLATVPIETLIGKRCRKALVNKDQGAVILRFNDGDFCLTHRSECCESVELIDIIGDISELSGNVILDCKRVKSEDTPTGKGWDKVFHSWTFIELKTRLGVITMRWYSGTSGAYGDDVDLWECRRVNK